MVLESGIYTTAAVEFGRMLSGMDLTRACGGYGLDEAGTSTDEIGSDVRDDSVSTSVSGAF